MDNLSANLSEQERIVLVANKHWVVFIKAAMLLLVAWLTFGFSYYVVENISNISLIAALVLLIASFLMLFISNHLFFLFLFHWELSAWVVTTDRVIDLFAIPFLREDAVVINIHEIHEIEAKEYGFIRNLLDYGDVIVNLAAAPGKLILKNVPHPAKFVNLVESIKFEIERGGGGSSIDVDRLHSLMVAV